MESVINRTLIIRLSSIGDIILASPLVRLLRKKFSHAQIDFLVKKEYQDLVLYNPFLSNVVVFDPIGGIRSLLDVKRRIRHERYDLIIDIHGSLRSRYFRGGTARKVVRVKKKRLARFLLITFKRNIYASAFPVALRYLETVRPFGIEDDGAGLEVFIPEEVEKRIASKIAEMGFDHEGVVVGICPGARHETKRWLSERFAQLGIALIKEENAKVMLFGGTGDQRRCAEIENKIFEEVGTRSAVANLSGGFSILETAAAMDACDVVVANDSGLLHLAAARKRKVVGIFGPTVKELGFFPFGTENKVVEREGLYCRPCTHIGTKSCPEGHFRCMKEIAAQDVMSEVRSLMTVAV